MSSKEIFPATAEHPVPGGEVRLLGAMDQVTGAMTMVDFGHARILVDCGFAQGRAARTWQFPEHARDADAVVLTHGHLDHVGSLPQLFGYGWRGPVFGTAPTLQIATTVLRDSIRLNGGTQNESDEFAAELISRFKPLKYDQAIRGVGGLDGALWMREAGHILGSASVEIETDSARLIVSGDLGRQGTPILRDPHTAWQRGRPVDLVVLVGYYTLLAMALEIFTELDTT